MSKETGGSAFPCEQSQKMDGSWNETFEPGMTLRDYFAAKAMQSLIESNREEYQSDVAKYAYQQADAMLEARK